MSSPSLTIYNFTINDIGSYRCSARNTVGIAHSPTMAFMDIPKCNMFLFHFNYVVCIVQVLFRFEKRESFPFNKIFPFEFNFSLYQTTKNIFFYFFK